MANRIDEKFKSLKAQGKTALAPFVTIGFPTVKMSEELAHAIVDSGGDMLELGIPFSDPLADGPTVQMTSYHALLQGVNLSTVLETVRHLRKDGMEVPLVLMGYYNPFLHYGTEKFIKEAVEAGADGIIVPDLPTEEAGPLQKLCDSYGMYLVPLIAPTSTDQRIADACKHAKGFIYCVSVAGVTGARRSLADGLAEFVGRVREHTDLPLLIGFGVSNREHIETISKFADGAIVASALIDAVDKSPEDQKLQTARDFIRQLKL
jgi:tryptophan synthase alpha chain